MRVLVLGHKGMLGHMVKSYLQNKNVEVSTADYRFPDKEFYEFVKSYNGDYIINCIGAIPQKKKQFTINSTLPIWLDDNANCRVVHAGTDCEMDNDDYGQSKRIASNYIKNSGKRSKIIKSSIIGPELETKYSLLEWFLNSEKEVLGYTKAMWNGNTTLEWAKNCYQLLIGWDEYETETILASRCVSKYELLEKIKIVFSKDISILESDRVDCNKCLRGSINTIDIEDQLLELKKEYYDYHRVF
jgi:dTDP-4-dehydrorhamnose reductase